jgi:carbon storage regulator
MLNLTGRVGAQFFIGDSIVVTICKNENGNVQLGFDAPKEIGIHRTKVWGSIKNEESLADRGKQTTEDN